MRSLSEKRSETRKISHNPEVSGSNPLPATVFQTTRNGRFWFEVVRIPVEGTLSTPRYFEPEALEREFSC